jgi:protein phosphatase
MVNHHLQVALGVHRGRRRKSNEDAVGYEYPADFNVLTQRGVLIALADGVGGLDDGEQASETAIARLIDYYYAQPSGKGVEQCLVDAVKAVNAELYRLYRTSATTIVAAVIHQTQVIVAHAGDSRAY